MFPPYDTEEIASAVLARLRSAHTPARALSITANDAVRTWYIAAELADGRTLAADFPYADREGIHTPGELADWFAARAKPEE